jgi:hypothetical protein
MPHLSGSFTGIGIGPVVVNKDPASAAVNQRQDVTVEFRVEDPGSGIALSSVVISFQVDADPAVVVYDGGAGGFQIGYSGSAAISGDGYNFAINHPLFPAFSTITVEVEADDQAIPTPNHGSDTYSFDVGDSTPPYVTNRSPDDGDTGVDPATNIEFDVCDDDSGVDPAELVIKLQTGEAGYVTVYDGGAGGFQAGYSGTVTPVGDCLAVSIDPTDNIIGSVIAVLVLAADLASPANSMQHDYSFELEPVATIKPVAVITQRRIDALIGSIIQLDARKSKSPDGTPIVWEWVFKKVPIGSVLEADVDAVNPASMTDLKAGQYSAISFIPDKLGYYQVQLTVNNGLSSDPKTICIEVGLTRALIGSGQVPDASFLWSYISNFYNLVDDKKYIETVWSGVIQLLGAEFIKTWSNDFNKSLDTIQQTVQRRWQRFGLTTDLSSSAQRLIVGNTVSGTNGDSGPLSGPAGDLTDTFHALVSADDFTAIDINYGAKGRIIDINGLGFTIERVQNVGLASVIFLDEATLQDGLAGVPYRIPHLLHVPGVDFEEDGVRPGDTLVLEFKRRDIDLTAEMQVQVVVVDRERVGFEFTLDALVDGELPFDHELFRKIVVDLRIVQPGASDAEIAAAAEALIAYVPTGINLSNQPFSSFQITIGAREIIHNNWVKADSLLVSVPYLQETVQEDPPVILRENRDYILEGGFLKFIPGLFTLADPAPEELWAEVVHVDNSPVIESNFGTMVELKREDLVQKATRAPYLGAVRGLWFALTNGPTIDNIRLGIQILMGLPFSEERGQIVAITNNFSTDSGGHDIGRILMEDVDDDDRRTGRRRIYFFPQDIGLETNPFTGALYKVGDIVERFTPLSKGITVTDYVKDANWWVLNFHNLEVLKFFTFKAEIDTETGVFNENDLVFSLEFARKIKPVYTQVLAAVIRNLSDDVEVEEELKSCLVRLGFYDGVGAIGGVCLPRADHINGQGLTLWQGDSRPFTTRSVPLIHDLATTQSGSDVVAGSALGGFGTKFRSRIYGDATHPTIEGDLLVIHPGQPGALDLSAGFYEITAGSSATGPLTLGNEVSAQEPVEWAMNAPDIDIFQFSLDLRATILRRALNPVCRGADLVTSKPGSIQLGTSASSKFKTDGVSMDDHLIIESGTNKGEYRIVHTNTLASPRTYLAADQPRITETELGLVLLDGTVPTLANASGQDFRIIRPSFAKTRVYLARVVQSGGNMYIEKLDFGAATEVPFDVFTPGMVGFGVSVADAENPANDGIYTIKEYIHAGRVRITDGAVQTSDASPLATVTISSPYHPGFELAEELAPTIYFNVSVPALLSGTSAGSSSLTGTLLAGLSGSASGSGLASGTIASVSGSSTSSSAGSGTLS